jgi:hypothetical protein
MTEFFFKLKQVLQHFAKTIQKGNGLLQMYNATILIGHWFLKHLDLYENKLFYCGEEEKKYITFL